jgi:hypothetical protein
LISPRHPSSPSPSPRPVLEFLRQQRWMPD